ncbi:MAG: AAA family ATPase [Deltaproteobacteria bacterium]|nr:AAA family ATPase [Deltaproteobacteria bacterium]
MEELTRFGDYELVRAVGAGDLGDRFLARRGESGRLVVVETFSPELMRRSELRNSVLDEARAAIGIDHPNLAGIVDAGIVEDIGFIAEEHVRGATIEEVGIGAEQRNVRLSPRFAAAVAGEAALGLDAAHRGVGLDSDASGIVHGCVRADRIWVRLDGVVKVSGIGRSRNALRLARDPLDRARTLAPELLLGHPSSAASDQFSIGIVLFELLTQQRFSDDARGTFKAAGRTDLETGDPELDEILTRLVAFGSGERFASCGEAAEALIAYANRSGGADAQFKRRMLTSLLGKLDDRASEPTADLVFVPGFLDERSVRCRLCLAPTPKAEPTCRGCDGILTPHDGPPPGPVDTTNSKREPLVERQHELLLGARAIGGAVHRLDERVVVFVGEPGSGKTRILEALEAECRRRRVVAISLPMSEVRAEGQALLRSRIAAGARAARLDTKKDSVDPWIAAAERGAERPSTNRPRVQRSDPRGATAQFRAAVIQALTLASQDRPICLLVDDLDVSDEECLKVFARLGSGTRRVAIVATTSDADAAPELPGERVALGKAPDVAVIECMRSGFQGTVPPILWPDAIEAAGGAPGPAAMLGRWLRGAGIVDSQGRASRTGWSGVAWPETPAALISACLSQQGRESRAIAVTGSLMAPSFSPKVIMACVGDVSDPKKAVRECIKSGLLGRSAIDERKIGYDQRWIRTALEACVPEAKRAALRAMNARALLRGQEGVLEAARSLASASQDEQDLRAAFGAAAAMGLEPGAAEVFERVLEKRSFRATIEDPSVINAVTVLATFRPGAALAWLSSNIPRDAPTSWTTYDALDLKAQVMTWLGDTTGAEAELVSKSELSMELEGETGAASTYDFVSAAEASGSPEAADELLSLFEGRASQLEPDVAMTIAKLVLHTESPDRARSWLESISNGRGSKPEARAAAHVGLAELQLLLESPSEAASEAERAIGLAERAVTTRSIADAELVRGRALLALSRVEAAKKSLNRALELYADLGELARAEQARALLAATPRANKRA